MVHPGPLLSAAVTVPPIRSTNFFTRARPIPVPPVARVRELVIHPVKVVEDFF